MFRTRIIGAIAVAVTLVMGITGCTSSNTSTSTSSVESMPYEGYPMFNHGSCPSTEKLDVSGDENTPESIIETDEAGNTAEDLLAYLTSRERTALYDEFVQTAGPVIAKNLAAGTFGYTESYTQNGTPFESDFEGWGWIEARYMNDKGEIFFHTIAYAQVWWNGTGSIDPWKSVYEMSVTDVTDVFGSHVTIRLTSPDDSGEGGIWEASLAKGCAAMTTYAMYDRVKRDGWGASSPLADSDLPASLEAVKNFDYKVISQFEANMDTWDLEGWE